MQEAPVPDFIHSPSVATWLQPVSPTQAGAREAVSTAQEDVQSTVFLTYGGTPVTMGKPGSFNSPKEWFGFKKHLISTDNPMSADAVFQEMLPESARMRAAIAKPFPVPQWKSGIDLPDGDTIDEIKRLDALNAGCSGADKVKHIDSMMEPNPSAASFEFQGDQYYLYGPFNGADDFINALKEDDMLQPVYEKWAKIDASILGEAFEFGTLYFQIKWQG